MVIELRVVQFWSEYFGLIFEIMCMILDQIALHLVQLPLFIKLFDYPSLQKIFLWVIPGDLNHQCQPLES